MSPELVKFAEKPTYIIWEKPSEKRIFVETRSRAPKPPREGDRIDHPEPLLPDQDKITALQAKFDYEQLTGYTVLNFHRDPMAGGLQARVPPEGQVWRALKDDITGVTLAPGNSKPGNTEMVSKALWVGETL